ncbi:MAG TPA: hypothetical protein ENN43_04110 [bacterium]|nr:hypothetical protein [bacterium]
MEAKIIGFMGGFLTTIGFIPQIIKGYKTKKMDDVALWQYILLTAGMSCWLTYGVMIKELPIILANSLSLCCVIIILIMKTKYSSTGLKSRL